jgi:hypothetical protein
MDELEARRNHKRAMDDLEAQRERQDAGLIDKVVGSMEEAEYRAVLLGEVINYLHQARAEHARCGADLRVRRIDEELVPLLEKLRGDALADAGRG